MTSASEPVPVLECDALSVGYDRRPGVVADVTLKVHGGCTLGLVGESGCGKSTLAKALVGLVPPTAGTIRFDGLDVSRLSARRRLRAGVACAFVFQDPHSSLDPRMTVRQLIEEPVVIAGGPRDGIAERLVDQVGLPKEALRRRPHEFSGGQRQRIAIARALAGKPRAVILDEPTSALDISVQAQILNLLLALQREHDLAYLFISHDLAVIRHMADDIAVMHEGRIVEYGGSAATLNAPTHAYTRSLIDSSLSVRPSASV